MAETIIAAAIGDVVSRVISLLLGRFNRRRDHEQSTKAKLDTICHMLIRVRSVVEEAKGRQILNHGTLEWLSELIRIEYEGRYLLDTTAAAVRPRGDKINDDIDQDGHHGNKVSATSLFNPSKRVRLVAAGSTTRRLLSLQHGDLDCEIDRVQERLRDVSAHLREFIMLMHSCQPIIISRPLPTNILRDGQMFGRHVEKESIVNFLLHTTTTSGCCSSSGEVVGVLPIVGDKGVGKTTLVQHACDDARVRDHFAVIMLCRCTYYTTSTNGGGRTPVFQYSKLISVGDDAGVDLNDGDALQDYFCDKRFLMVFEDVVDMNQVQMLEGLLSSIGRMSAKEGCRVIITTNSRHVAAAIGTVEPVTLNFLPFPEYWFFFKAHAFAGRDAEENPRLVAAGKAIAMKLNGSFFGAKTIGEVLRDQPDPKFWCRVLGNTVAGLSLLGLGDCIAHVWDLLAHSLLPGHVEMCEIITVSSTRSFRYQTTTSLARLQDLCRAAPHHNTLTCWADSVRFGNVLLCKSVFPFHNAYHIARCSCTCAAGWPICM